VAARAARLCSQSYRARGAPGSLFSRKVSQTQTHQHRFMTGGALQDGGGRFMTERARAGGPRGRSGARLRRHRGAQRRSAAARALDSAVRRLGSCARGRNRARARRSRAAAPRRGCRSLSAVRAAAPLPAARGSGRRTPAAARCRSRAASCALPRCANRYLRLGYRNRQQERLFRLERRVLLRPRLLPARRAPR